METNNYLTQFASEIENLVAAYRTMSAAKNAWREHQTYLEENDLPDDAEIETLVSARQAASNEYDHLRLALEIKAEKAIGKGSQLGNFWSAIFKMQKAN